MKSLNTIRDALEEAIEDIGGEEMALEICDRMYTSLWRDSEPKKAGELFAYGEDWYPELEGISKETLVVGLCNYKGEGEGYAKWEDVKHLPVFRSKDESFFQMV